MKKMVLLLVAALLGMAAAPGLMAGADSPPGLVDVAQAQQSVGPGALSDRNPLSGLGNGIQLAQQRCPSPDAGYSYCGIYGGSCLYCPGDKPHICPAQETCHRTLAQAQATCGAAVMVCGR